MPTAIRSIKGVYVETIEVSLGPCDSFGNPNPNLPGRDGIDSFFRDLNGIISALTEMMTRIEHARKGKGSVEIQHSSVRQEKAPYTCGDIHPNEWRMKVEYKINAKLEDLPSTNEKEKPTD